MRDVLWGSGAANHRSFRSIPSAQNQMITAPFALAAAVLASLAVAVAAAAAPPPGPGRPGGGAYPGARVWPGNPGYRPVYPVYGPGYRPVYRGYWPGWNVGYWGPRGGWYYGGPAYWYGGYGAPAYWGAWPYAAAWGVGLGAYGFGYPYVGTPLVVTGVTTPPVYIQQDSAPAAPAAPQPPADSYWYYCPQPAGYYPYVKDCSQPWMKVVPQVPGSNNSPPQLAP